MLLGALSGLPAEPQIPSLGTAWVVLGSLEFQWVQTDQMAAELQMVRLGAEMSVLGWPAVLTHLPDWVAAGRGMSGQARGQIPACIAAGAGASAWQQSSPEPHLSRHSSPSASHSVLNSPCR